MFDDLFFIILPDAEKNLPKIEKRLTKEAGDRVWNLNSSVRGDSQDARMGNWKAGLYGAFGGEIESVQTLDYECETASGPVSVAVHVGNSREITNIEYFARWKPTAAFPPTRWERRSFVSDDSWPVIDQLNSDGVIRKSVKRLLSSKYVMTNLEDAVLYSSTTLRTENIPLFGIVLSLRFGIGEFLEIQSWLKQHV